MSISSFPLVPKRHVDVIWNTTLVCPWDCGICCVDAINVRRHGRVIIVRSENLTKTEVLQFPRDSLVTAFDLAEQHRQAAGLELSWEGKLRVLDNLANFDVKLDISGGDPLCVRSGYELLRVASSRFGRERITLTATGVGLMDYTIKDVAPFIGEFNFTFDGEHPKEADHRPHKYAYGNLRRAQEFARVGVLTRAECPLTTRNIEYASLETLYVQLHEAGIKKLLIMRLFPVGRGRLHGDAIPNLEQYKRAISYLRDLETRFGYPIIKLQCALKFIDGASHNNPCDLLRSSFGLMTDGTLLASPWAIGSTGLPIGDAWVLGNLSVTPLVEILASAKVRTLETRLDENIGHCKIFAYNHSRKKNAVDRIVDIADPLYI